MAVSGLLLDFVNARQSGSTFEIREWPFVADSTRLLFPSATRVQVIGNGKYSPKRTFSSGGYKQSLNDQSRPIVLKNSVSDGSENFSASMTSFVLRDMRDHKKPISSWQWWPHYLIRNIWIALLNSMVFGWNSAFSEFRVFQHYRPKHVVYHPTRKWQVNSESGHPVTYSFR